MPSPTPAEALFALACRVALQHLADHHPDLAADMLREALAAYEESRHAPA